LGSVLPLCQRREFDGGLECSPGIYVQRSLLSPASHPRPFDYDDCSQGAEEVIAMAMENSFLKSKRRTETSGAAFAPAGRKTGSASK
jgi:hypothetical protein